MLTKQIETILYDFIGQGGADGDTIREYAEKIASLSNDNGAALAAAMLENEITSTLMDMTVATVLATLIEEEGGGRSNIGISPLSMDHMMKHYLYEVRNEGMIRHVSIKLREDSNLQDEAAWREPSNRHGVMHQDEDTANAKPQAEPKAHDRPVWAVRHGDEVLMARDKEHAGTLALELSRAEDRKSLDSCGHFLAEDRKVVGVQNRWCLHLDCPASGCNHDPKLRDE